MEWKAAFLLALYLVSFAASMYFRLGEPKRWAQRMLVLTYRNASAPRAARNLLLFWPITCALLLPLLLLAGVVLLNGGEPPDWPHWARSLTVYGLLAYVFFVVGGSLILAYREPSWLIPGWLKDDNRIVGWKPLPANWVDRFMLAVGILIVVTGTVAIFAAIGAVAGVPGL